MWGRQAAKNWEECSRVALRWTRPWAWANPTVDFLRWYSWTVSPSPYVTWVP